MSGHTVTHIAPSNQRPTRARSTCRAAPARAPTTDFERTPSAGAPRAFRVGGCHPMEPALLARGFVLGFTIAAAVGPISLLCIKRTLAEGRTVGFVSGLGVATADATYGAIAAFGLTAITDQLVAFRQPLAIA